jgi:hypothetical protein
MVRSKQLALGQVAGAGVEQTVYSVPAGHRTILKEIRGTNRAAGAASLFVIIRAAGVSRIVDAVTGVASGARYAFAELWTMLSAGDELRVLSDVATSFTFVVSGSELDETP